MVTNGTKFSDYRTSRGFIGCTGRQRVTDDTVRSVVPREHRESWTIAILSRCLLLLFFLFFLLSLLPSLTILRKSKNGFLLRGKYSGKLEYPCNNITNRI